MPVVTVAVAWTAVWWFLDSIQYGNASSLHRAVMRNDVERVKRLVGTGADASVRMHAGLFPHTWGATPLHLAARDNRVEIVEVLLRAGADKNAEDELGFTPLHASLWAGADGAAGALVRAGAELRSPPREGRAAYALENCGQPLRTALSHASIVTVEALLGAGADLQMDVGDEAMAYADGPDLLAKLRVLFDRGFSVDVKSDRGEQPLHVAVGNKDTEALAFLLDHGADIEARGGDYEFPPLLLAAELGWNDGITALLERGADPKARTADFGSLLYVAAFSGKRETVRLLLSMNLGIDVQAGRASDLATPLHFAYWNNDSEMAELLIKAGADPTARTTDGRLPVDFRK
ncbi:Protein PhlB [Phycisphaerales bacterium]|nr:Protein PhlB [Phycisphaerales bacterium]